MRGLATVFVTLLLSILSSLLGCQSFGPLHSDSPRTGRDQGTGATGGIQPELPPGGLPPDHKPKRSAPSPTR
jgi:hypothetical protein